MTIEEFAHKFPEWALAYSLMKVCGGDDPILWRNGVDASILWRNGVLHTEVGQGKLCDLYPPPKGPLRLYYERSFDKFSAARYRIDDTKYQRTYWGLRPDFVVEGDDPSLMLLIEAKGGDAPKRWENPKELPYYRFLEDTTWPSSKGFFYIVPKKDVPGCQKCLNDYFPGGATKTGWLVWEELLPIMGDKLIVTALDEIIKETEGLKLLREWQREHL